MSFFLCATALRRWRRRLTCTCGLFVTIFGVAPSRAQAPAVRVEYSADALACPSQEAVQAEFRIARLAAPVHLFFERSGEAYRVTLTVAGQRRVHTDRDCAPLLKAAFVSAAILSPEPELSFETSPANEMPPVAPRLMPIDEPGPRQHVERRIMRLGVLPTAAYGMGAKGSVGTGVHLTFTGVGKAVFGVGLRGLVAENRQLLVGAVQRSLAGGWVDACLPFAGQSIRASACILVSAHSVFAQTSGLYDGAVSPRARVGAGGGLLGEGPLYRHVLWQIRVDVDSAIYRETFNFTPIGSDLSSPLVSAVVEAGVVLPINE